MYDFNDSDEQMGKSLTLTTQFTADKGQMYVQKAFGCPLIYLFYFKNKLV